VQTAAPRPRRRNSARVPTGSKSPTPFSSSGQTSTYEAKRVGSENPFRLQISHFGLSDQSFGTPHVLRRFASCPRQPDCIPFTLVRCPNPPLHGDVTLA
jgi:hypothetical protein